MSEEKKGLFWFIQGNVKVLMYCRLLWSGSTSIIYPYFSLYILALGGTSTEIGLINSLGLLAGMILYPLGGYIADRSGRVKFIGYSTLLYTFAHLFFVIANDWKMIALGQFFSQLLLFYMPAMGALEADSLPPDARGRGFAIMMTIPGAVRIVAPVVGGYVIEWFRIFSGWTQNEALVIAVRVCWSVAFLTGLLVAWIRIRYLKETVRDGETNVELKFSEIPKMVIPAYKSIFESIRWMDRSLKVIVVIEMFTSFFVAMSAPFYVVYAKQIIGIVESQWGLIMFISGLVGVALAFPLGALVDKVGSRKMILTGMLLAPISIWAYQYAGGFTGVALVLCIISLCNSMMMPAFSTIIANIVPRSRRGRLYSLIGERGITISFGNFWGGGFLIFPPAALGAYIGGWVYKLNPNYPWIITSLALLVSFLLILVFVKEPEEIQQ
ncbi:MFS transporter [Candidatus Bathyarchaeota archaeon]|nr:MFS transporter [Candidatus Bathyarchaeota archaeon]MBL7167141.1 MFS transporter [Candidatus Bathyarchaeota archaeon]